MRETVIQSVLSNKLIAIVRGLEESKANGDFCDCVVECQTQKPHCLVVVLGSLTALGFVAI